MALSSQMCLYSFHYIIEARPEDFKQDQRRFYIKRAKNRGTLLFSRLACLLLFSNTAISNSGFRGKHSFDRGGGFSYLNGETDRRKGRMCAWLRRDRLQTYMLTSRHRPQQRITTVCYTKHSTKTKFQYLNSNNDNNNKIYLYNANSI